MPDKMLDGLSAEDLPAVQAWWAELPSQAQEDLTLAWDDRAGHCGYSLVHGEAQSADWKDLPVLVGARFLPNDDRDDEPDWNVDFYEYLINNPELGIHFNGRTVHICTTHPAARVVLRAGVIPAAFKCPLEEAVCPMRKLLRRQPGHRVVLHGARPPSPVVKLALPPEQAFDHLADAFDDAGHADAE